MGDGPFQPLAGWLAALGVVLFVIGFGWQATYLARVIRAEQAQVGGEFGARYATFEIACPPALVATGETIRYTLSYDNQTAEPVEFPIEVTGGAFEISPAGPQVLRLPPGEDTTLAWQITARQTGEHTVVVRVVDIGRECLVRVPRIFGLNPSGWVRTGFTGLTIVGPLLAAPWLYHIARRRGARRVWLWLLIRYGLWYVAALIGWGLVLQIAGSG